MISDVKKIFNQALEKKFGQNLEVKRFLLEHPRKQNCLTNLCTEIVRCEKGVINFNANDYKEVIESVAGMFAFQAIRKADEDHLSSVEKIRRITEAGKFEESRGIIHELEKDGALKIIE